MSVTFERMSEVISVAVGEAAGTRSNPESKLRELVAPLWEDFIRSKGMDISLISKDERQLANGRADTV